jgi:hypothetical protein
MLAAGGDAPGSLYGRAAGCGFLPLAASQRLFKTGAAAGFADDTIKLHFAVKALEHPFEAFIILGSNFCQENHPFPSGITDARLAIVGYRRFCVKSV